jgi:hypothetical protein
MVAARIWEPSHVYYASRSTASRLRVGYVRTTNCHETGLDMVLVTTAGHSVFLNTTPTVFVDSDVLVEKRDGEQLAKDKPTSEKPVTEMQNNESHVKNHN